MAALPSIAYRRFLRCVRALPIGALQDHEEELLREAADARLLGDDELDAHIDAAEAVFLTLIEQGRLDELRADRLRGLLEAIGHCADEPRAA